MPSNTHIPAKNAMGTHMRAGTSLTNDAASLLDHCSPQNTRYAARTITTMVKILTTTAMTAAHHSPARASARYTVSLLQNPLRGGKPAIASAPRKKQALVIGIRFLSPPSSLIRRAPVAYITAPTHMNSSDL